MASSEQDRRQLVKYALEYVRDFVDAVAETLQDSHEQDCLDTLHRDVEKQLKRLKQGESVRRVTH